MEEEVAEKKWEREESAKELGSGLRNCLNFVIRSDIVD